MSCLTGSGRAYGLELVKSPSTSTRTSQTSSPSSSTITDSSNSPLAITTRKPRTPRKRPNQTYNEAAALLSTVYPNIFSIKHFSQPHKFLRPHEPKSSELFLPLRVSDNCGFLLHHPVPEKPKYRIESKLASFSCLQSGGEIDFGANSIGLCEECREDFDAESILDEEIEEGIDSIMGNLSTSSSSNNNDNNGGNPIPVGLGFGANSGFGFGVKRGIRAFRHVDNGNCWSFPTVDVHQISPRFNINNSNSNSKSGDKKKKKMESKNSEELAKEKSANSGLLLKLNYDKVLNAWSDRASPFSDETPSSDGNDVSARARLSEIDLLFSESGVREARAMRYKEKRRTRPFSRKIRYQVRKVNSDERPRMKGRFVRRPRSSKVVKYGK